MLDSDFDGFADRLYVGDTGGRMWRFNVGSTDPATWTGNVIAFTGTDANDHSSVNNVSPGPGRKIFFRPTVTLEYGYTMVAFGTGDRAHPLNTALTDRLYMVKDRGQGQSGDTPAFIDDDDLVDVTQNSLQNDSTLSSEITTTLSDLKTQYGWYIDLNELFGEKVLAPGLLFNKVAYYTTYTPNDSALLDPCSPGNHGVSRLYAVDYKTGEAVLNCTEANDTEQTENNTRALSPEGKVLRRGDRSVTLGVGIPSGLVVVIPPSGDAELLIGCGGGLCQEDPLPGKTIFPVYWTQW